jgi:predicted nucleic acid-binding protein
MSDVWLDANVVLRFITKDPPDQFRRAQRLMRHAVDGDVTLRLSHITIAESVWVLDSFYGHEVGAIADTLRSLVTATGVDVEDADVVLEALRLMADSKVAFADAYVAATARRAGEPVATFDADLRRLGVELVQL